MLDKPMYCSSFTALFLSPFWLIYKRSVAATARQSIVALSAKHQVQMDIGQCYGSERQGLACFSSKWAHQACLAGQ